MKFEIDEKVTKSATKKALDGIFEAADTIVNTCDNRLVRNVLSGLVKSTEDAINQEISTKTILPSTKKPAEVTHIEKKEQEQTESTESGGIEALPATSPEGKESQTNENTQTKVSSISD